MMDNFLLQVKQRGRRILNISRYGNEINLNNFVLKEKLTQDNLIFGYSWASESEPYHPDKLIEYYDKSAVEFDNDIIKLKTIKDPKLFNIGGILYSMPYKVGVLRSTNKYFHGYFECSIKLDEGRMIWPAFWLTGSINWPPEIDVIEAYSKTDNYGVMERLQSNVHYRENTIKKSIKGQNHPLPKSLKDSFVRYGVLWEDDKVEFYYNGYLVRRVTDKKILSLLNEPMVVIINTAIQDVKSSDSTTEFKNILIYTRK
jgi:beta-glucanase (GH16 family)